MNDNQNKLRSIKTNQQYHPRSTKFDQDQQKNEDRENWTMSNQHQSISTNLNWNQARSSKINQKKQIPTNSKRTKIKVLFFSVYWFFFNGCIPVYCGVWGLSLAALGTLFKITKQSFAVHLTFYKGSWAWAVCGIQHKGCVKCTSALLHWCGKNLIVSAGLTAAFTGHKSQSGRRAGQPVINLGASPLLLCKMFLQHRLLRVSVQSVRITIHVDMAKIPPKSLVHICKGNRVLAEVGWGGEDSFSTNALIFAGLYTLHSPIMIS